MIIGYENAKIYYLFGRKLQLKILRINTHLVYGLGGEVKNEKKSFKRYYM